MESKCDRTKRRAILNNENDEDDFETDFKLGKQRGENSVSLNDYYESSSTEDYNEPSSDVVIELQECGEPRRKERTCPICNSLIIGSNKCYGSHQSACNACVVNKTNKNIFSSGK